VVEIPIFTTFMLSLTLIFKINNIKEGKYIMVEKQEPYHTYKYCQHCNKDCKLGCSRSVYDNYLERKKKDKDAEEPDIYFCGKKKK
jgi:hypothetical protein